MNAEWKWTTPTKTLLGEAQWDSQLARLTKSACKMHNQSLESSTERHYWLLHNRAPLKQKAGAKRARGPSLQRWQSILLSIPDVICDKWPVSRKSLSWTSTWDMNMESCHCNLIVVEVLWLESFHVPTCCSSHPANFIQAVSIVDVETLDMNIKVHSRPFTASRASIPRPCSRFGWGMHAMQVIPRQGTRGATCGVGMGYSDYMEWGTCCTQAMNGLLHGLCMTCTLPPTQFGYTTYLAAGLRPGTRATHDTYTVRVCLSLDLVFF